MSDEPTFTEHFATLRLSEETLRGAPEKTIVPPSFTQTVDDLPLLRTRRLDESRPELTLKGTLGEGGMGVVSLATQTSLDREVAVKRAREGDSKAADGVLSEAFVTGWLEHPNVVPVHVLGRDEEDAPMIVMKRVEGVSWLEVMRDPGVAPGVEAVDLRWHLNVLIQVSNALRFAHNRGVVHRDIKPENVMIGAFGEVYLVDWGIAVSTEPGVHRRLRYRGEAAGVAGTPAYMAPEMTDDDAARVDERTDVYLLGATLHEILTGQPRHHGDSMMEVMMSAYQSEPVEYSSEVPEELAAIANRATHRDADARHESVEGFRADIEAFLEHRAAVALANEADERLERARRASQGQEDELARIELFAEVRFGYRQALELWPEFERARLGLQDLYRVQFDYHIERREEDAARAILTKFEEKDAPRAAKLEVLRRELEAERAEFDRLRELEREEDLTIGSRTRMWLGAGVVVFWGVSAWYKAYARWGVDPYELETDYLLSSLVTIGVPLIFVVAFRRLIRANAFNRRLVYLLLMLLISIVGMRLVAHQMEVPLVVTTAFEFVLYGFAAAALGVMTDIRIALSSIFIFGAAIAAALYPTYQMIFIAVAIALFAGHQFIVWWPSIKAERSSGVD